MAATTANANESDQKARSIASKWLVSFNNACKHVSLSKESIDKDGLNEVVSLFLPNGFWRDRLCLSWNFRTAEGADQILAYLSGNSALAKAGLHECIIDDTSALGGPAFEQAHMPDGFAELLEFSFRFEIASPSASGRAYVRLMKDDSVGEDITGLDGYRAFTLLTAMEGLKGHEEEDKRPLGHYNGHTRTWDSIHAEEFAEIEKNPTALVVGGGQAGLMIALRLKKLGIKVLVVEKNPHIGDNWRQRYDLMTIHTTVTHFTWPYQQYPESMPLYIPRTKLADFMQFYTIFQEIPVWTSSTFMPYPTYDRSTKLWTVTIKRNDKIMQLKPKHLIMATGVLDMPIVPEFKGMDEFEGPLMHSGKHKNAKDWKGKKVVVVGTGVSAGDIAFEAESVGAAVTMIQRSPTCLVRVSALKVLLDRIWPAGRPVEASDFIQESTPMNLFLRILTNVITPAQMESEKEVHEGLRKQGYLLSWGEEAGRGPVGQLGLVYLKLGGFCLDIGCAEKIIEGKIKVKSGVQIEKFDKNGITFSDGSSIEADAVVLATGYHNMRTTMFKLLGEDIVSQTSEIWGLDKEGEFNGIFRPTGHPGLWYAAGGFSDIRSLSKYLALQILGRELGLTHD